MEYKVKYKINNSVIKETFIKLPQHKEFKAYLQVIKRYLKVKIHPEACVVCVIPKEK